MKQELVKDWMTKEVLTITPDTSIFEAHRLMTTHKIRRLPVVRDRELIGLVTRGDIRGAQPSEATSLSIWEINYLLAKTTVADIMTKNPVIILASQTVGEAARMMLDHKISGLPVVDMAGSVVGIITESDIFRMIVTRWETL
ncbi:MAG: CBS domain-containing protein [Caldilineales bacterium]|nr:CBS domain-containing protein [Caldilineales bacterium]